MRGRVPVLAVCLLGAGCLISEQAGVLLPDGPQGDGRLGEISLHFDSTYNRALVYGRSALLVMLALFVFALERGTWKKTLSALIGVPVLAASGWLVTRDLPTLQGYRVQILASGLFVRIPPGAERKFAWDEIEAMTVHGQEYPRLGSRAGRPLKDDGLWKLGIAEWKTADLKLTRGETSVIDLTRLSIEHRQTLFLTIAKRAGLVEQ